jgi:hypothetical protein
MPAASRALNFFSLAGLSFFVVALAFFDGETPSTAPLGVF